ncbi:hypothetical protein AEGHOMDF_0541 [Methylobacterium soli]|nr:hypothetical protein AEGHOMDF_0541 [Methylobacterium soli]
MIVLAEVGSRALSSAINDSGTAIEVIGALVRVLTLWHDLRREEPEAHCHRRLYVPEITADDLFVDGLQPIARDGAGIVEVGIRLQKGLAALATLGAQDVAQAATRHADLALARALSTLTFAEDRAMITAARHDGAISSGIPKD